MEVIQIKPRNPSNTSTACVLDVLERQFDIEVSKTTQDGDCYIAEVKGIGSFEKIQKELLKKSLRLRKWEFKLVTFHHKSKSHEVFSAKGPLTADECVIVNITYSDPAAFKDGKLPSVSDLKEKFMQVADHTAPSMSGYNYAVTINKVDLCSLYCFQTTQPSPQSDGSLWKHLVKVEVEYLSSYCNLDDKTFYYEFLSDIVSDHCWICWKSNKATIDGIILDLNLKKEENSA
ncbi:PREDICTED: uncharacterized protein LOC109585054 [Amphimedon queenslandica]|uniref:Uncharacterized protein n=1 Tax=Amphimedon queenslandica TaxID=400682 RepID=A0A1X7U2E3_AMPQE|nr:PREDICTED: uncharacterized protein LOC109585054 [Amphimedon queenslandica]|eukprot:XP_019856546.1 PREDICTED: uncharacterized protein LOC109585054 [Amphimedon queenslandica]